MSVRTRNNLIKERADSSLLYVLDGKDMYAIPKSVAVAYKIRPKQAVSDLGNVSAVDVFNGRREDLVKAASLLRGLRSRENLTQVQFAKRIQVSQANLSKMENGSRPIGKMIAKRIAAEFDIDYRYFLE